VIWAEISDLVIAVESPSPYKFTRSWRTMVYFPGVARLLPYVVLVTTNGSARTRVSGLQVQGRIVMTD